MQCTYQFHDGTHCTQKALEGRGGRCLFHHDEAWRTQVEEIINGIEAKFEKEDFNFEGYRFPKIEFFAEKEFKSPVNFQRARFHGSALFSKTKFSDYADFSYSTFSAEADFKESKFDNVDFSNAQLGTTIFNDTKFLGNANYNGVILHNANFRNSIFKSTATFVNATFSGTTHFHTSKFQKVDFTGARFSNVSFYSSIFSERADFNDVRITTSDFSSVSFGEVNFYLAQFSGHADFHNTNFSKVNFMQSKFSDVNFNRSQIIDANFNDATFLGIVDFTLTQFSEVEFINVIFKGIVNFNYTKSIKENDENKKWWKGDFTNSTFEKTATFKDAYIDPSFESTNMPYSNLRDIQWPYGKNCIRRWKKKLYDEREADDMPNGLQKMRRYRKAVLTYFFLRNRLHSEGDFIDESDFFYRERYAQKKLFGTRQLLRFKKLSSEQLREIENLSENLSKWSFMEWLWLSFVWWTCGFGERTLFILANYAFIWLFFAFLIIIVSGVSFTYFFDALYVSLGALSNMGTNLQDIGFSLSFIGKWLIQFEALIGIFLISLFLVVFVRKMSRQ